MKTLLRFFRLSLPFWADKKQWFAWALLLLVIAFALGIIQVSVWITEWNKHFYDAIAEFNGAAMPRLIAQFFGYIALIVAFITCGNWLRKALIFRWREHLTEHFQKKWLENHRHYFLENSFLENSPSSKNRPYIDNPDQRIAEDIALLSEQSVDLFKYFIMNCAKLGAFISILWQISGVQSLQIGQWTVAVSGYLVWIALIYSAICTWLMHKIGHKLQGLNVEKQQTEADYRRGLLQVREHSEQIAAYRGEAQEGARLANRFEKIKNNWFALMGREFKVEMFSATYMRVSWFIPIFATLPMYLARSITFGDTMQARSAFGNVQDGFGWFMDYYKRLIEWAATVERLATFDRAMDRLLTEPLDRQPLSEAADTAAVSLLAKNIAAKTPQGEVALAALDLTLPKGQWLRIDGASGVGKSTLLKTLAGLWANAQGEVRYCADFLFLPQKPYLMEGSLREVLSYPLPADFDDEKLRACLKKVGLFHLTKDLDSRLAWQNRLSGGEQQRIGVARALLLRPKLLFLDESSNQLDDPSALALMRLLKSELPDSACLLVSHQSAVKALCDAAFVLPKKPTPNESL